MYTVLAVTAPPDDMEICCAGTLLKCKERGDRVVVCHLSNGDLGHVVIMPEELGKIRVEEAKRSGAVGGIEVIWGGFTDLEIYENNKESRDKLVDIIRDVNPDFIITHDPNDYMPDHTAVSKLVFDAAFAASVPHYVSKVNKTAKVTPIYYMDTASGINFVPTEYVDITSVMETKMKMVNCHESQVVWLRDHDNIDYPAKVRIEAQYRGYQCGAEYAEGFRPCLVDLKCTTKRFLP